VPLSQRGRTGRGIALALLFGLGLTLTLTMWGAVIATVGGFFGFREFARYLSIAGGAVAYVLGLWTLALVRFPLPSGSARLPARMAGRSEYIGALLLGLLFGNMGLCCPDPVFLSMMPFMAASGSAANGGVMAAAYGLGRATPLVVLVVLARTGVNAVSLAARHKQAFDRAIGWGLVAIGTLMLYGYGGVPQGLLLAEVLMTAPVLAYHLKARSSLVRTFVWLSATALATLAGLRIVFWILLNLP
jgi:cytochrome c-type biogenesis protein